MTMTPARQTAKRPGRLGKILAVLKWAVWILSLLFLALVSQNAYLAPFSDQMPQIGIFDFTSDIISALAILLIGLNGIVVAVTAAVKSRFRRGGWTAIGFSLALCLALGAARLESAKAGREAFWAAIIVALDPKTPSVAGCHISDGLQLARCQRSCLDGPDEFCELAFVGSLSCPHLC